MAGDPFRRARARGRWRRVAAGLVVIVVLAAVALGWALTASVPTSEGVVRVRGLQDAVTITFDAYERAYVEAGTLEDALYAEGFLHARERLWQMELLRRAGSGRLAELLGPALIETDRSLWRSGVPQLASRLAASPSAAAAPRVAAYVSGVNAGIDSLRARAPEFLLLAHAPRPWTVADVYAVGAMIAWDSSNNLSNELVRHDLRKRLDDAHFAAFLPDEHAPDPYPYVVSAAAGAGAALAALDSLERAGLPSASLGSNGWALAPERTRDGRALLAFDSHDTLSMPTLFYEVHLFFDGGRQVRGWSLPGLPGVINGYNEYLAWGLTNIGDTQDLFELQSGAPLHRRETVEIPVRGRSRPEELVVEYSDFGPVVLPAQRLALSWTGHQVGAGGLDALFALNLASDLDALHAAFDAFALPVANITWATRDGHIGFRTLGLLPRRSRGDGLYPQAAVPGAAWSGIVPAAELPRSENPPEGFVAAANARVNAAGNGPLVSADNSPPYRIRRIRSVLGCGGDLTAADMRSLQRDWWNTQAELLLPVMLPALSSLPEGTATAAAAALREWQSRPVNEPGAAAPLIFERWYLALAERIFREEVGSEIWPRLLKRNYLLNHAMDRLLLGETDSTWWDGARDQLLRESFATAVTSLLAELGPAVTSWRWDARHEVVMQHELGKVLPLLGRWLDRGPYPWGGGAATVGRANYRYDAPTRVVHGATVRMVADMGPGGLQVESVMSAGQSGNPASDHYADQVPAWLAGELIPIADRPDRVTGTRVLLEPEG